VSPSSAIEIASLNVVFTLILAPSK